MTKFSTHTRRKHVPSHAKLRTEQLLHWAKQPKSIDILQYCNLYDMTRSEYLNMVNTDKEFARADVIAHQFIAQRIKEAYWEDSDKRHFSKDFLAMHHVDYFEHIARIQKLATMTEAEMIIKHDVVYERLKESINGNLFGQVQTKGLSTASTESDAG